MIDVTASFDEISGAASPSPMTAAVSAWRAATGAVRCRGLLRGGIPEALMVAAVAYGVRDIPHINLIALLGSNYHRARGRAVPPCK